ncbi:MAG TPA: MerR family DNA-binding transcriptional regulator [Gaiellaceae bacterium]|nr:MerR family DNA-binding transcriptional regulator [Gaiellaceae bacterium]
MRATTVGQAATETGWSPRMLRYLERAGLVVPRRTVSGYRTYGLLELNQLRSLQQLRQRFRVELRELAFAARLRREPDLRAAVDSWLAGTELSALDWEQRKHERLLAA